MRPAAFRYTRAASLEEALAALGDEGVPLAGGQSLLPLLKLRQLEPRHLVDLNGVRELEGVGVANGSVTLGALTRLRELAESDDLRRRLPSLADSAAHVADVQVRNRGTLGGNVCFADPRGNLAPVLISLGTRAQVVGPDGGRAVPVEDLFAAPRRTVLAAGELVTAFEVPAGDPDTHAAYAEVAVQPNGVPLVNVAVSVTGQPVRSARVAAGGLGVPLRASHVEQALSGRRLDPALAEAAAGRIAEDAGTPVEDLHAGGAYRLQVAQVLLRRMLTRLGTESGA